MTGGETEEQEVTCIGDPAVKLSPATHEFLKALSSPSRQQILLLFSRGAEMSVGDVAKAADLGQSTASQQLAWLRRGRVLKSRRDGKEVLYSADREATRGALADLQSYLDQCC